MATVSYKYTDRLSNDDAWSTSSHVLNPSDGGLWCCRFPSGVSAGRWLRVPPGDGYGHGGSHATRAVRMRRGSLQLALGFVRRGLRTYVTDFSGFTRSSCVQLSDLQEISHTGLLQCFLKTVHLELYMCDSDCMLRKRLLFVLCMQLKEEMKGDRALRLTQTNIVVNYLGSELRIRAAARR